jgi:outer membrane receptor protein involved in Fe transport
MKARPAAFFLLISFLSAGVVLSQQTGAKSQDKKQEKKREQKEEKEKEEKTKLFQLNPVIIDVIEYLRDKDIPNMVVVKPELFPMTIGVTLDTALARQSGVDIQRIQEIGTAADDDSIKLRGMGARRIKVLKNGRALNSSGVAGGYFIDWTMIPLAGADRVEVIKGVGDPRYGNVLGGVINLVSKGLRTEAPRTEVQASYSSFRTPSFNLFHGFKPGAFEYSLSASANRSDGYLKNGDMNFAGIDLHLGYDFPFKGRFVADLGYLSIKKEFTVSNRESKVYGVPGYAMARDAAFPVSDGEIMYGGMGAYAEPGSWWKKKKWTIDLGYEQAFQDKGFLAFHVWQNHGDREAFNTRNALSRVFHKMFFDDRSQGLSLAYKHYFPGQTLTFGADYSHLKDDGEKNYADDFRAPYRFGSYVSTKNLEFYLMDDIRLLNDRFSILPGLRYIGYEGLAGPQGKVERIPDLKRSGLAPSLKLAYEYARDAVIYVSAARALRMPTAPEHFWHYDYDSGVDTSMLPFREEDGLMLQAGWKMTLPSRTRIEIAPYYYVIQHYIQFDLINFVAFNIDRARIYGIECEASQAFRGGWSVFANYTYQKSLTKGDPFVSLFIDPADRAFDEIPGLPAHKVNAGIQYRTARGASAALFVQAVSSQKVIYNNNTLYNTDLRLRTQGGYARLDFEGRYPVAGYFDIGVFVRNIFNASYQERFGFPAAGRNSGISLKARF